jgi:cold shock CspA family protein/ribosome-associated translation inhibitor RaiA
MPIQIVFRQMRSSPAIRSRVLLLAEQLERFEPRLIRCRVVVEVPHRHNRQGRRYHIRIELTVPGRRTLVVNRNPSRLHPPASHEDIWVALQDAFDAAKKKLEENVRVRRGLVKVPAPVTRSTGKVVRLVRESPEEGGLYGFIEDAEDGAEVYFHEHSVAHQAADTLRPGMRVQYTRERGVEGPQAAWVDTVRTRRRQAG